MNNLEIELINWHASANESARRYFMYAQMYEQHKTQYYFDSMCFWYERAVWGSSVNF